MLRSDSIDESCDSITETSSMASNLPFSFSSISLSNWKISFGERLSPQISVIPLCNSGPSMYPLSSKSIDSKTSLIVRSCSFIAETSMDIICVVSFTSFSIISSVSSASASCCIFSSVASSSESISLSSTSSSASSTSSLESLSEESTRSSSDVSGSFESLSTLDSVVPDAVYSSAACFNSASVR